MHRILVIVFGAVVLLLGGAVVYLLNQGRAPVQPVEINEAEVDAVNPYRQEMECIDRLMQQNDLQANQVDLGLAGCRGGAPAGNATD